MNWNNNEQKNCPIKGRTRNTLAGYFRRSVSEISYLGYGKNSVPPVFYSYVISVCSEEQLNLRCFVPQMRDCWGIMFPFAAMWLMKIFGRTSMRLWIEVVSNILCKFIMVLKWYKEYSPTIYWILCFIKSLYW